MEFVEKKAMATRWNGALPDFVSAGISLYRAKKALPDEQKQWQVDGTGLRVRIRPDRAREKSGSTERN